MLARLFLLFTIIPLTELFLLIKVGQYIGALTTIAIVLLTGFVGAWLARMEGFAVMTRLRENLNRGAMPTEELIDGFLILVAGAVLLTPGFLTDVAGLLLLFPPTRKALKEALKRKFRHWVDQRHVTINYYP